MSDDWNLSEKIFDKEEAACGTAHIHVEHIKTFIQKEQDLIVTFITEMITETEFWSKREKLVGDDLI